MKAFRRIIFWAHLCAGLVAGLSIAVMCFTGVALAFEKQIVAWAERDARRVERPEGAARLPIDELARRVRESNPGARPSAVTVSADPRDAVAFSLGREGALYANPYTGEVRAPASTTARDFLQTMENWHRVLALGGDNRAIGKAINGACNLAFCALAITGLFLWWPRNGSWKGVKAVALLNFRLGGKARDFNWHNSIGLWCAPVLIVLTLTAIPMSYRWGGTLIERLAGEAPPPAPVVVQEPTNGAHRASQDSILRSVQAEVTVWTQITIRSGGPQRGRGGQPETPKGPQPFVVTVTEPGTWPRTATTTLSFDPFSGALLQREGFVDLPAARRVRSWTRFLHTGEALGVFGQAVAGLACLGGLFLVYTGFALTWRRFFGRRTGSDTL